ncbi:MAG: ABC transporter permease [Rhodospirillaceae bacterium]|nr:ABC transporter permease [Rhodospirillaceae bacterium]
MMADAAESRARLRAAGLALPLVAFVGVTFVAPLASMLVRSVYDPVVADALPETVALLGDWDGMSVPDEAAFEAAARELVAAQQNRTIGQIAGRANRVQGGLRSVLVATARRAGDASGGSWRDTLVEINPAWEEIETWHALRTAGERFTTRHYLAAVDLTRLPDGSVVRQAPDRRIYVPLFARTLAVSLGVTLFCLILGYPLAHLIAHSPPRRGGILLALVLVPFWTSLLVRTTSWIVLLQNQGVINDLLVAAGFVADNARLALIYNMTGTFVAMTHVLLPFMVLPLYSVMRTIPRSHMSAAASLGAGPAQAFRRVYWPQSLPGVGAGSLLVFILAIGYYITPALVGGSTGQLISNMVAYHMQTSLNWGLASALGGIILVCVTVFYILYDRITGGGRIGVT